MALLLVQLAAGVNGEDWVTLAWDPNSEPDLGGYIVYYGAASRAYTNAVNVGNVTTHTVTGLVEGVLYYFAVTAYNTNGLESDFSDEVTYLAGSWMGRRLSVRSANPSQGIWVSLSPPGSTGQGAQATPFEVVYAPNQQVRLTAPPLSPGSNRFDHWVLDGAWAGPNPQLLVTMDRDHTAEAVYRPRLTLTCAPDKAVACGTAWSFDPPTAQPASNDVAIIVLATTTNRVVAQGTLVVATRTWLVTNALGEQAHCSQTVTVHDTVPPSLRCAPDKTAGADQAWVFDEPTAMDACGPAVVSVVTTWTNAGPGQTVRVTRVWRAVDAAGNRTQCSQTVTVLPTGPRTNVLAVTAAGPQGAVLIAVDPEDLQGLGQGPTPFTRRYSGSTVVTLIAPQTAPDGRAFAKWQRNGLDWAPAPRTQLLLDTDAVVTAVYAPLNDRCTGAMLLMEGVPVSLPTTGATTAGDPSPDCAQFFGAGVWFAFSPTQRGRVTLSTCGSDYGFDTVLQVFRGHCGALEPMGCNDDNGPACPLRRASLLFDAEPDTTYLILAGGYAEATGNLSLLAELVPTRLLTVSASGLTAPIQIAVSPSDLNGLADGRPQFSRLYPTGTELRLTAPATGPAGERFRAWHLDGQPWTESPSIRLWSDTDHWLSAVYCDRIWDWGLSDDAEPGGGRGLSVWPSPRPGGDGAPPNQPRITRLEFHSAHGARLLVTGQPGQTYQIRASTNLTEWSVIGRETAGPDGLFVVHDATARPLRSRFYQVVQP